MSLRRRLQLFLFLLHAAFFALALFLLREKPLLVVGVEAALILSFLLSYRVLSKALIPLDFARQFKDLLHDENYAARMKASGDKDVNDLAGLFNRMLETLYQERLRIGEQRGFLEKLLEATPGAVVVFDFDGKVSLFNAFAADLFGHEIAIGKRLGETQDLASRPSQPNSSSLIEDLKQVLVGESRVLGNAAGRRFRCQRSEFVDRGFRREFLLIDEITEELASSERATYEKLVRVLAHEVNNTVAATSSVLESLLFYREQLHADDGVDFATAIGAVQRRNHSLAQFIARFTEVVKMPEPRLHPSDVGELVDSAVVLYRQACHDKQIVLEWEQRQQIAPQLLDASLFEQVIINILKNAIEAAEARKLRASGIEVPAFVKIKFVLDTESKAACLSIIDSGQGLQNIPTSQLFTPFFTTKKGGQGIGLMFVREVLQRHHFQHRLATNADGDTQFDIIFCSPQ